MGNWGFRLDELARLEDVIMTMPAIVVAVSGGIDSMTLMAVANRLRPAITRAAHAVSHAVPVDATRRVRRMAARHGWTLDEVDAAEFRDTNYVNNPINRCFFCKSRLYTALGLLTKRYSGVITSGANLDDLGDFRPGLEAARIHSVRHPFIEASIDKAGIRRIACAVGLEEYADLPASPCLASRVETGLKIVPEALRIIDVVETDLRLMLDEPTVRCRLRSSLCEIELGDFGFARLNTELRRAIAARVLFRLRTAGLAQAVVKFGRYRKGSAFIGSHDDAR
jgi:pyridinium-3,5-biscarboxylic acid mononucleotide sulfurtransferase